MLSRWFNPPIDWVERFSAHAARAPAGPLQEFYRTPPPAPDFPLRDAPMIALDLETTGLDPEHDAIVSVGMITMDLERIHCRGAHHWLYKPDKHLSAGSVTIHGITHSDVRHSPRLKSDFDDILAFISGSIIVAHFAPIERRFLEQAARTIHGYPLWFPMIDTMELERRYFQRGLRGLLSRVESLRLDDCRGRLHLPRYKAHHALTDALATAELLQAQVAHRYRDTDPVSWFWV